MSQKQVLNALVKMSARERWILVNRVLPSKVRKVKTPWSQSK